MSDSKPKHDPSMDDILASIRKIISDDESRAATDPGATPSTTPARPGPPRPMSGASSPANPDDDVLLLTDLVEEPSPSAAARGAQPGAPFATVDTRPAQSVEQAEGQPQLGISPIPSPPRSGMMDIDEPQPSIASRPPVIPPPQPPVNTMSQAAPPPSRDSGVKISAAFERLNQAVGEPEPEPDTPAASSGGAGGKTVEDLVREMLKPMLQDWIDRNLPDVVDKAVDDLARGMLKPELREWMDRNLPDMVEKQVEREIARLARR